MALPDSPGRSGASSNASSSSGSPADGVDGSTVRPAAAVQRMEESLLAEVSAAGLRGSSVLIACSGGPDSMALLNGLSAIRGEAGLRAVVGTVDHGLRPESSEDAAFVLKAAGALNLECASVRLDVSRENKFSSGMGIEAAARFMRYEALRKMARDFGCGVIATAHTMDDQAETLLMRLAGGCGLRGARGILKHFDGLFRPMLGIRRREVLAYLAARGIHFCVDSTNASCDFTRNRVRISVIPALEKALGPGAVKGLARFCAIAAEAEDFIAGASEAAAADLASNGTMAFGGLFDDPAGGGLGLQGGADMRCTAEFSTEDLEEIHPALRYRILERAAANAGGKLDYSGFSRLKSALEKSAPQRIQLPGGAEARIRYGRIRIGRAVSPPESADAADFKNAAVRPSSCGECGASLDAGVPPSKDKTRKRSSDLFSESTGNLPCTRGEDDCLELEIPRSVGEIWRGLWFGRAVLVRRLAPFESVREGAAGILARAPARGADIDPSKESGFALGGSEAVGLFPRLILRTRRPGDVIRPRGAGGAKKLKDFFIDAKIPSEIRGRLPLVVGDGGTVLAIPGIRDGEGAGHRMGSEGGAEIFIEPEGGKPPAAQPADEVDK